MTEWIDFAHPDWSGLLFRPPRWTFDWLLLLVPAALLVFLGVRVWRDRPAREVNRWFAFQALLLAGWVTGVAAAHSGTALEFWGPWTFANAAMLPFVFVGFAQVFPERTSGLPRWLWRSIGTLSVLLSIACFATPWVVHDWAMTCNAPQFAAHSAELSVSCAAR
jgi:hypothetical protein